MERFEVLDIAGDVGLKVYGGDERELFVHAALGMYSLVASAEGILEDREVTVSVKSGSLEGLLVSWLNELIFHFDAYGFIGKRIEITRFVSPLAVSSGGAGTASEGDFLLEASVFGETFDPIRHEGKLLIKAATYHRLSIRREGQHWEAVVIFDI